MPVSHTLNFSPSNVLTKLLLITCITLLFFISKVEAINTSTSVPSPKEGSSPQISFQNEIEKYQMVFDKGDYYYQEKRFSDAITHYNNSLNYLPKKNNTTLKLLGKTYTKIAQSYKRLKDRTKTVNFYKKSLEVYTKLNDKKNVAHTLNTLAEAERYQGNLVIALDYSLKGLQVHSTINDPEGYAKALIGAGIIYRHIERYEKSLNHIHKAYLYYKDINNYNGIAKTSNEIGNIYIRLREFDQAKFFFQKTITLPEEQLKLKTLASALREMAVIAYNHQDYKTAMLYAKKAYKIYQKEDEKLKESVTARIIANIYRGQKNRTQAIDYYQRSMLVAINKNDEKHQIEAQIPLAEMFVAQDTEKAVNMLINALKIAIKIKDEKQIFHTYHKLSLAEEHRNNFKQALYYAKKEIEIAKKIQTKSEDKKLILAKAALYSRKVEIELASLREKTKLDSLELTRKNNEIEIANQTKKINELELRKKQYSSIALTCLTVICLTLVIVIYRSFSISKKRNKELYLLASRDHLTSCLNRRALFKLMEEQLLNTELNKQYCVIMTDIDNFKNVNDTYGHNKGDVVIKGFAATLQSSIRQGDIVARYGGEEFCIILKNISQEKALEAAEDIRKKVENTTFSDISITSSFGVTSLEYGANTASELIEQADIALYKSKELGRNKVTFWSNSFAKNKTDK